MIRELTTSANKRVITLIAMVLVLLVLLPSSPLASEKKAQAAIVVCSPSASTTACTPPLKPAFAAFTDMQSENTQDLLATAQATTNYTYAYLTNEAYGACTVTYSKDDGYQCVPFLDKAVIKESFKKLKALGVSNVRFIVSYRFDQSAIQQINQNNDADKVASFIGGKFKDHEQYDGILLDFGSNPNTATANSVSSLNNENGQKIAEELSFQYLPKNKMLNVAAGIPGWVEKNAGTDKGTYPYAYTWQFWTAINRANRGDCITGSACQMGNYIYPLYNKSIDWYPFISGTNGTRLNVAFNLSAQQYPFQMRLISEMAAEVNGYDYPNDSGDATRTVQFAIKPIQANGGSFGGPDSTFGYYQLGVMASGTNLVGQSGNDTDSFLFGTSPGYATFDSSKALPTLIKSRNYWGANDPNNAPALPAVGMTYKPVIACGGKYKDLSGCASYRQRMEVPAPYSIHSTRKDYRVSDILNQYVCTQLNAISYVYSSKSEITQPPYFCGIGYNNEATSGKANYRVLTFDNVTKRTSGISNPVNLVFPYRQDGYQTMVGPVIYQVVSNDVKSKLLNDCFTIAKGGGAIPDKCVLIPVFGSVWDGGDNSTWSMIVDWATENTAGSKPVSYIADLPSYSTQQQQQQQQQSKPPASKDKALKNGLKIISPN
ncbi:MAG: hypothetical protein P1U40_01380 [Coxiellaceae bacterium]|nr:hypothetical protein [Coxiellaceae bacterium]